MSMWHLLTIIYLVPFLGYQCAHSPQTVVSIKFPRHLFKIKQPPTLSFLFLLCLIPPATTICYEDGSHMKMVLQKDKEQLGRVTVALGYLTTSTHDLFRPLKVNI